MIVANRLLISFLIATLPSTAFALDWFVSGDGGHMCLVHAANSLSPQFPERLAKKPDVKGACQAAKDLYSETGGLKTCIGYQQVSYDLCTKNGVKLP